MFVTNQHALTNILLSLKILCACLLLLVSSFDDLKRSYTVKTSWATIIGQQERVIGREIGVFLGIPYAKPPVGELRFARPQQLEPYNSETFRATKVGPSCPQRPNSNHDYPEVSEDCLYLNLWAPVKNSSNRSNSLKPVIVYMYGGGFDKGSVNEPRHFGDILASIGDLVVVTVNHRINILGFSYGATESMPGNMGAYDLIKSLEWINMNIKYFGGDPDKVLLFGACSGAMAASTFALSPMVGPKLFSRMYLASSVVMPDIGIRSDKIMFNLTRTAAEAIGCGNPADPNAKQFTETQIACMKNADLDSLLNVSVSDEVLNLIPWKAAPPFGMIFGTDLIPASPDYMVVDGLPARKIPILFGNEEAEDEFFVDYWPETKQDAIEALDDFVTKAYPNTSRKQLNKVHHYYFDQVENGDKLGIKKALTEAAGDFLHHCTLLLFTEAWTRNGQITHGYLATHVMEGYNKTERPLGTKHGDTAFQILGQAYRENQKFTDSDRRTTKKMMKVISQFAHGKRSPWPPMIRNSRKAVLALKWKWTKEMNPKNVFVDPKDKICHLWGRIRNYAVV